MVAPQGKKPREWGLPAEGLHEIEQEINDKHQIGVRRGGVMSPWSGLLRAARRVWVPERTNFTFEDPDILEISGVDDDEQSGFWRGLSVCCVGLLGGGKRQRIINGEIC